MNDLEVGQILSMKIRFNNSGVISKNNHPYLIVGIDTSFNTVEIAQLDSLKGKEFKAGFLSNKVIFLNNPMETVIDKDSYIQMDNTFKLEFVDELMNFRRQTDKLSEAKLKVTINAYNTYHATHHIDENKIVYMDKAEIQTLNRERF